MSIARVTVSSLFFNLHVCRIVVIHPLLSATRLWKQRFAHSARNERGFPSLRLLSLSLAIKFQKAKSTTPYTPSTCFSPQRIFENNAWPLYPRNENEAFSLASTSCLSLDKISRKQNRQPPTPHPPASLCNASLETRLPTLHGTSEASPLCVSSRSLFLKISKSKIDNPLHPHPPASLHNASLKPHLATLLPKRERGFPPLASSSCLSL